MSIQELSQRFKAFLGRADVLLAGLIVAVSLASYGLGRLSTVDSREAGEGSSAVAREAVRPTMLNEASAPSKDSPEPVPVPEGGYVASKNGTKYHLPWCGSAKQIKEENKIWFATKAEAEKAGYTPASNCPGI